MPLPEDISTALGGGAKVEFNIDYFLCLELHLEINTEIQTFRINKKDKQI